MMAMIVMLRCYQIHCADQDQHIRDWTQVTHEDFTDFRRSYVLRDTSPAARSEHEPEQRSTSDDASKRILQRYQA